MIKVAGLHHIAARWWYCEMFCTSKSRTEIKTLHGFFKQWLLYDTEKEDVWVIWNTTYKCADIKRLRYPVANIMQNDA